jgi:hypothetical protein
MMLELIRSVSTGFLVALVLHSGYSISSFQKFRPFVTEAFSNMRIESRRRFLHCSNPVVSASGDSDLELSQETTTLVLRQPPYKIAGLDLSASWVDLVRQNKVSASVNLPPTDKSVRDNRKNSIVEYGIRLVEKRIENLDETRWVFEEYVQQLGLESIDSAPHPLITNINATLARSQRRSDGSGTDFKRAGNFVAQLQLVRTLRPPPSEGFQDATTSKPPPYNPNTDSFVTGPLRLDLRPLVGCLKMSESVGDDDDEKKNILTTSWDVFHNIGPADRRGHFLLLPSLLNKERNWRGQRLTKDDCHDLVHLASAIEPVGSMFLGYNSVGAGASQNHIHCHSWPYPSIDSPTIDDKNEAQGAEAENFIYAVNKVDEIYDFYDVDGGTVEVSYLDYPVVCIQMSSSIANLNMLGRSLAACLDAVGEAPHNIGFLNRIVHDVLEEDGEQIESETGAIEDPTETMVDVFLFVRSKERSSILPTLKLGISEMMGVFHAQSETELDILTTLNTVISNEDGGFEKKCAMEQALADVSREHNEEFWNNIVAKLAALENEN